MRPDGNCRACVVEVKGERVLAASCCRTPAKGMEVTTDSERAVKSQKMVLELLLSDMPAEAPHAAIPNSISGRRKLQGRQAALRGAPSAAAPICRITASRSISIRASSARAACAPAAKSR